MIDREVNELLKDTTICADIRWVPHRERLSEVSGRYLMSIKNDYERIHSKPALPPADVVQAVHAHWIRHDDADIVEGYYVPEYECSKCGAWKKDDSDFCPDCGAKMDEG